MASRTVCFRTLLFATTLAISNVAVAQTGPDLMLNQFRENRDWKISADSIYIFDGETNNADSEIQLSLLNLQGMMKLDLDSFGNGLDLNRAQPRAGFEMSHLNVDSDDPVLRDHYTDASFGIGLGIGKGEKWVAGASVAVGHASSNTFGDGNGWYGRANIAIGYTINERETFGLVLDYDGNRTIFPDIPLPGFVYRRALTDELKLSVGVPYTDLEYKPDDRWTILLRYVIPSSGEAAVEYKATEAVRLYASLSSQSEAFHSNELSNSSDRILFKQYRAEVGVRGTYNDQFSFFVAGGYAFAQEFEVGWDTRDSESLAELSDEPYVHLGFELNF